MIWNGIEEEGAGENREKALERKEEGTQVAAQSTPGTVRMQENASEERFIIISVSLALPST